MAKTTLIILPRAVREYKHYYNWYLNKAGLIISSKFSLAINKAFDLIENNPYIAPATSYNSKLREYVVRKFPFIIAYEVVDEVTINILTLLHGKMDRKSSPKILSE